MCNEKGFSGPSNVFGGSFVFRFELFIRDVIQKWHFQCGRDESNSYAVPNSNPLGIQRFVSGISVSFKCECHILMEIQYTKNLNAGRFELGTTLS